MDWKANFKHVFQVVFLNCMFCFSKGDLNHCYWWRFVLSELCFTLCVVLLVSERDNQVEAELDQKSQEHHAIHSQQDNPIHQGTPIQSAPTASIPPPAVIHAVPPPPLPNQVLPNMVAVLPGLPPFNTNQLTHLPPPPPLVSTHLPPPLLSPGALPPPPHPQSTALVTQEQVWTSVVCVCDLHTRFVGSILVFTFCNFCNGYLYVNIRWPSSSH